MKSIYTICFLFLSSFGLLQAQQIQEFSDLSSSMTGLFNSVKTTEGIVYFINDEERNKLVKIDFDGNIVQEQALPFEDSIYYNGHLLFAEENLYLVGHQRLFPNGTNDQAVWDSQMRSVLQFDDQLALSTIQTFPTVPFGGGEVVSFSGTSVGTYNLTSTALINGQLINVWPYVIFDTDDNFSILGKATLLEVLDLAEGNSSSFQLFNTSINLGAIFQADHFWVLGETADTIFGGTAFNPRPIAKYNYEGELLQTMDVDLQGSGGFSDGIIGKSHNDRIYLSYFGKFLDIPGCETNTSVIDIRDQNMNLITRKKLPDCELYTYGQHSFAFIDEESFYFVAPSLDDVFHLYKYDIDLNVIWTEQLELPNHIPMALKVRPDQGVILECLEFNPPESKLKLYAFTADGTLVNTQSLVLNDRGAVAFGPNPTEDWIYPIEATTAIKEWRLYAVSGQLLATYRDASQGIDLSHFPKGTYLLQSIDEKGPIGVQKIAKH